MNSGMRVAAYARQNGTKEGGLVRLTAKQQRRIKQKNRRNLPGGKVHHKWMRQVGQEPRREAIAP